MAKKKKKNLLESREIIAPQRLKNELEFMQNYSEELTALRSLEVDPKNPLRWTALILPDCDLYSRAAFKIEINFPKDYPLRAPRILFLNRIYHPNVSEEGKVCLPCIAVELWKPTTRVEQILQALVALVNNPDPYDPIDKAVAQEYLTTYDSFKRKAILMSVKYGAPRPPVSRRKKKQVRPGMIGKK